MVVVVVGAAGTDSVVVVVVVGNVGVASAVPNVISSTSIKSVESGIC